MLRSNPNLKAQLREEIHRRQWTLNWLGVCAFFWRVAAAKIKDKLIRSKYNIRNTVQYKNFSNESFYEIEFRHVQEVWDVSPTRNHQHQCLFHKKTLFEALVPRFSWQKYHERKVFQTRCRSFWKFKLTQTLKQSYQNIGIIPFHSISFHVNITFHAINDKFAFKWSLLQMNITPHLTDYRETVDKVTTTIFPPAAGWRLVHVLVPGFEHISNLYP